MMENFLEDQVLIERALSGEERAFAALVQRHQERLARLIHRITDEPALVPDLLQETFLRAFQNLSRFERRASFLTWLYRIAINVSLSALRQEKAWREREEEMASWPDSLLVSDRETGERIVLNRELQRKVQAALSQLAPEKRVLLTLRYLEELSTVEIAKILSLAEGTVRRRLWEARQELARLLRPYLEANIPSQHQRRTNHDL